MPRTALNRKEVHSADMPIEQKRDIAADASPAKEREIGDISIADPSVMHKDYLDELAFMEEPVTIRIERGSEEHAPQHVPLWCNGRGCELMINGKWVSTSGWIPVDQELTVKRKYLEVLARAKIDKIETIVPEIGDGDAELKSGAKIRRATRQANSFSVIEDKNPRGHAWLTEIKRRNM